MSLKMLVIPTKPYPRPRHTFLTNETLTQRRFFSSMTCLITTASGDHLTPNCFVKEMGEDIRTFARQFAGNLGTEFVCRFGNCGANFRTIHEMIGHLCTTEAAGGHESTMRRLHNRSLRAQPATSYTLGESIEQAEEDSDNSVGMAEGDHPGNSEGMPDGDDPSWSSTHRKRESIAMKLVGSKEEGSKRSRSSKKVVEEPKPKLAEPIQSLVSSDPISVGDDPLHRNRKASYAEKGKTVALEIKPTPNVPAANERLVEYVLPTKEKVSSNPIGIFGGNNLLHSSAQKDCKASYAEKGKALEMERTLNVPATVEKSPSADCKILHRQWTDTCAASFHSQMEPLENFEGSTEYIT